MKRENSGTGKEDESPENEDEMSTERKGHSRKGLLNTFVSKVKGVGKHKPVTETHKSSFHSSETSLDEKISLADSNRSSEFAIPNGDSIAKSVKPRGQLKNDASFRNLALAQNLCMEVEKPRISVSRTRLQEAVSSLQLSAPVESAAPAGVWIMKFSQKGEYLAVGRNDGCVILYIRTFAGRNVYLKKTQSSLWKHYSNPDLTQALKMEDPMRSMNSSNPKLRTPSTPPQTRKELPKLENYTLFDPTPHKIFRGHILAITDLSWSKNDLLLSSSVDNCVRLWHTSTEECLCTFQHADCVSSVFFNPINENLFASGCLDGRIRTWNIKEKKMINWREVKGDPITSIHITKNGAVIVAGTFSGLCIFYDFLGLKYNTQVNVSSGKYRTHSAKIIGIQTMPKTAKNEEQLLITSGDSKIRLYNLRDKSLLRTYRGAEIRHSKSSASFSADGQYIVIAAEDKHVVVWDTTPHDANQQYSGVLSSVIHRHIDTAKATGHEKFAITNRFITCAIFAPWLATSGTGATPTPFTDSSDALLGTVLLVSDDQGDILVYEVV
jgi:WD40 repeat protein